MKQSQKKIKVENKAFAKNSPLDTDTKFVRQKPLKSNPEQLLKQYVSRETEKSLRVRLWNMRRIASKIHVPENGSIHPERFPRIARCGIFNNLGKSGNVMAVKGKESGRLYFSGLMNCGSVWRCPVCAFKITRVRQLEVFKICSHYMLNKHVISFVTLTVAHKRLHSLKSSLDLLLSEFRAMQRLRKFKTIRASYVGMIKALEITHGANGWHPHLHLLLIHNKDVSEDYRNHVADLLLKLWHNRKKIKQRGTTLRNQVQKAVRSDKDVAEYVTKWDASCEITKSFSKKSKKGTTPFGMLDEVYARKKKFQDIYHDYAEYVVATKGRNHLIISSSLKKEISLKYPSVIKTDDEILKDEQIGRYVFLIDSLLWSRLVKNNHVPHVLNAYEKSSITGVMKFLISKNYYAYKEVVSEKSDLGKELILPKIRCLDII